VHTLESVAVIMNMTICICGSLSFYDTSRSVKRQLEDAGYTVLWPWGMELMEQGTLNEEMMPEFKKKNQHTAIKRHYEKIKEADVVLIVNEEKNGIKNYIGGNTLIEMGFAHVLDKPIYLLHPIPDMTYREELEAMRPRVLRGNIKRIKNLINSSSNLSP